jgi:hypothetical protein
MAVAEVERALKKGRPATQDQLRIAREILKNEPARLESVERRHMENICARVADGRPIAEPWVAFVRDRDPALAAEWEAARLDRQSQKTGADRVAAHVARRNEIGPLPAVVDQGRRDEAAKGLLAFGLSYGVDADVGFLLKPPSPRMIQYVDALQRSITQTGRIHIRLPRGKGKTAWAKLAIVWAVSNGWRNFPVVFSATQTLANAIRRDIWDFIERGATFGEDYPEIAHPLRCLDGKMQRADGQTLDGVRTRIARGEDYIVFPTVSGGVASGAILIVRGVQAGCRGLVKGNRRPDYILFDDIETKEAAQSIEQIRKLEDFVQADALGLGGHDRQTSAAMTSTPITPNDLSERYADPAIHPEWETISFPLVISFPQRQSLWDQYQEIYNRCKRTKDSTFLAATAFFRENLAAMMEGAEVLDDSDGDPHELNALQHAMNLLFDNGKKAFYSEYQLAPPRQSEVFRLAPHQVAARINRSPRLVVPPGCQSIVVYCDVNSQAGLRWSAVAFGAGRIAGVIAYGRYPSDKAPLIPQGATMGAEDGAVAVGLARVHALLSDLPFARVGARVKPAVLCFDGGWKTKVVARFCAAISSRFPVIWAKGFAESQYKPYAANGETRSGVVATPGDHTHLSRSPNGEFLAIHTDYWRETAQRACLAEPLQPGSLSLYGDDPLAHYDYAEEICAEYLADKGIGQNGSEFWKWGRVTGAQNHWLDTLSSAFAVASWYHLYDATDDTLTSLNLQPRRALRKAPRRVAKVSIQR